MRSRMTELLQGISALISDIAAAALLLILIPFGMQLDFYVPFWLWLGAVCIQFLAGYFLLSLGTSVNFYLIVQGIFIAGNCVLVLHTSYCNPGWENMCWFLGLFVLVVSVHAALAAWYLPEANQLLRFADILVILLAFFLYTEFYFKRQADRVYTVLPLAAMLFDLWTISRLRTAGEQEHVICGAGTGGKLLLLFICGSCLFLTVGIVGFGAEEVHSAVDVLLVILRSLWAVITLFFRLIGAILAGILLFFLWILPAVPQAAQENIQMAVMENVEEAVTLTEQVIPLWFFALLGILCAVGILGWILYQYRGKRWKVIRRHVNRKRVVRNSCLFEALKALFCAGKEFLIFEWKYWKYRKTPQGLFVLAEREGRKRHLARKKNESPGSYLRRLSEQGIREDTEQKKALCQLSECLERLWYAGETSSLSLEEYKWYEKAIRELGDG